MSAPHGRTPADAEWRAAKLVGVAVTVFLIGLVPYAYAWSTCPAGRFYTGLMFNVPDHAQYWSWVTASRDGLFISNTMTPEPNPPLFMHPFMWLLARVQAWTGWSFAALFQFWRLMAALAVVPALAFTVRTFLTEADERRTAFWVALLGSGLGWIWVVVKYATGAADVAFPHDLYTVEPNTFWGLLAYPYLPLAQALLVLAIACAWRARERNSVTLPGVAAAAALGLALTHPYDLLTIYVVLGAAGAVLLARDRRLPAGLVRAGLAVGLASAPVAFYYQQLTARDPLWQAILAQYPNAGVWTPPHLHLIVLMGIPLVLAGVALAVRLPGSDAERIVAVWFVAGLVLIYLPVVYQIKLLTGWQVPVAMLAAMAWHRKLLPAVVAWRARRGRRTPRAVPAGVATLVLLALTMPTTLYLFAWRLTEMRRHDVPYFLHADDKAALDWLAANSTSDDVALAPLALGQFVPNYGRTRAFVAHWAMTVRFFERRDAAERFFDPGQPDAHRDAVVAADRVTLVIRPTPRQGQSVWLPADASRYRPVFRSGETRVFRVEATPRTAREEAR